MSRQKDFNLVFIDPGNQRKTKTEMGERRHGYVWYDGSSKQSDGGQASISQRHLGRDVLTRICSEKKKKVQKKPMTVFLWRNFGDA